MLRATQERFNKACNALLDAKDMAGLQKYLTDNSRTEYNKDAMFNALLEHGAPSKTVVSSTDSPLGKAITKKDDIALALLIHYLITNHDFKITLGNSPKDSYLILNTEVATFPYLLPPIDKALAQKVKNNLELFTSIDKAFGQDRENCLLGRLPKINFAKFDLDFFEKVYLKDIKGDHDKRLIAYRMLNACAKSPDSSKENQKRAQQLMGNLQAEHSLHRNKVDDMHDGKYLNENSALGKFVLEGDKKKIAQLMVKAQKGPSPIATQDVAAILRSNTSLDIQMALFDIAAEHNKSLAPKSRLDRALESIANFFNNITIFGKRLGNDTQKVAEELKGVLGHNLATELKNVLGLTVSNNIETNPVLEVLKHNQPEQYAAPSKVKANAKLNPSAEGFGREDTAPPVKNVDKSNIVKEATNKEIAIKELKDLCEVFSIDFLKNTHIGSPTIRSEYQKAINALRDKVDERDLRKLDLYEIALCPKEPGVNR
jgi:hypothetical protein